MATSSNLIAGNYVNIEDGNNLGIEKGSYLIKNIHTSAGGYGHGQHDYYPPYKTVTLENGVKFSPHCFVTHFLRQEFYTVTTEPTGQTLQDKEKMNKFNANTNWLNGDDKHEQKGREHFACVLETLEFYQEHGTDLEGYEHEGKTHRDLLDEGFTREEVREIEKVLKTFEEVGDFHEYGLSFGFVEADAETDGYYRFQICWGGPSSEIRFYPDGKIEAVYMDWFVGVGFNVNNWDAFQWLKSWLEDVGSIDFDSKDCIELYSEYWEHEEEEEEY